MTDPAAPKREFLLTLSNPIEGKDEEYREWYWGEHIEEVLAVPGFVAARRFRAKDVEGAHVPHLYATIYEVEGSAVEARNRVIDAGVTGSDTMDPTTLVFAAYEEA